MGYVLGAADYMTKPIDFENLCDVLRRLEPGSNSGPVLVVEDDAELRELERRALEKAGMQVVTAENGRVALERIGEGVPRIILLDLMMPEMDGFEFLDALREKVEWRSIPVIVVTAKEITPAERKALQGRVSQILEKGAYDLRELLDIVRAKVASYTKRLSSRDPAA